MFSEIEMNKEKRKKKTSTRPLLHAHLLYNQLLMQFICRDEENDKQSAAFKDWSYGQQERDGKIQTVTNPSRTARAFSR